MQAKQCQVWSLNRIRETLDSVIVDRVKAHFVYRKSIHKQSGFAETTGLSENSELFVIDQLILRITELDINIVLTNIGKLYSFSFFYAL